MLELAAGRRLREDVVAAFGTVRKRSTPLGWVVAGAAVLVVCSYPVLTG